MAPLAPPPGSNPAELFTINSLLPELKNIAPIGALEGFEFTTGIINSALLSISIVLPDMVISVVPPTLVVRVSPLISISRLLLPSVNSKLPEPGIILTFLAMFFIWYKYINV